MIYSLFSCFDPCSQASVLSGKWLQSTIFLLCLGGLVCVPTHLSHLGGSVKNLISLLLNVFSTFKWIGEGFPLLLSTFVFISLVGVVGLVPYSFAVSSHLSFTLSLSLPLWVSGLLLSSSGEGGNVHFLGHLLPQGSPVLLWPFLVLVESVSLLIRPLTLGVRLMANVIAGHLILSLLGSGMSEGFLLNPLFSGFFLGVEMGISMVQAYVFVTLLSLYWDE